MPAAAVVVAAVASLCLAPVWHSAEAHPHAHLVAPPSSLHAAPVQHFGSGSGSGSGLRAGSGSGLSAGVKGNFGAGPGSDPHAGVVDNFGSGSGSGLPVGVKDNINFVSGSGVSAGAHRHLGSGSGSGSATATGVDQVAASTPPQANLGTAPAPAPAPAPGEAVSLFSSKMGEAGVASISRGPAPYDDHLTVVVPGAGSGGLRGPFTHGPGLAKGLDLPASWGDRRKSDVLEELFSDLVGSKKGGAAGGFMELLFSLLGKGGREGTGPLALLTSAALDIARDAKSGLQEAGRELAFQGTEKVREVTQGLRDLGRATATLSKNNYHGLLQQRDHLKQHFSEETKNIGTFAEGVGDAYLESIFSSMKAVARLFRDLGMDFFRALIAKGEHGVTLSEDNTKSRYKLADGLLSTGRQVLRDNIRTITGLASPTSSSSSSSSSHSSHSPHSPHSHPAPSHSYSSSSS